MARLTLLAIAVTAVGCAGDDPMVAPTKAEFVAMIYQEPDTGMYVLNGDETATSLEELDRYFDRFLIDWAEARAADQGFSIASQGLAVNTINGIDDKWPVNTVLRYCVSQKSFGGYYLAARNAMVSATAAWVAALDPDTVSFQHLPAEDTNCTAKNTAVDFDVRGVRTKRYLARAFFPSYPRQWREILVSLDTFGDIAPWTPTGVLNHEVGHALGFRHEHTRPESGVCFEDNNWRALTAYDAASVMHYPQCNGTNDGDLELTNFDRQGAAALY